MHTTQEFDSLISIEIKHPLLQLISNVFGSFNWLIYRDR